MLVAALDAPFELRARRPDYTQPPVLDQVLYGPGGQTELSALDNVELREIILKGKPRHRRVEVPPWNGIDTGTGIGKGLHG